MKTKQEIKQAYKSLKFSVGIFQIKNKQLNKIYLQTTLDLDRAFNADLFKLNAGMHPNKSLQKDWNDSGADNFEFKAYDELNVKDTLSPAEINHELKLFLEMHLTELKKNGQSIY